MARDSLEIIPRTPSSAGTMWRQPLPAEAPVLYSVSRAMGECTWDLTDTIEDEDEDEEDNYQPLCELARLQHRGGGLGRG